MNSTQKNVEIGEIRALTAPGGKIPPRSAQMIEENAVIFFSEPVLRLIPR